MFADENCSSEDKRKWLSGISREPKFLIWCESLSPGGLQKPEMQQVKQNNNFMRKWLSGRASPCQGEGREFKSRLPLHFIFRDL